VQRRQGGKVYVFNVVMGPVQNFLTRVNFLKLGLGQVGSAIYGLCLENFT